MSNRFTELQRWHSMVFTDDYDLYIPFAYRHTYKSLTWLHHPWLGSQISQVNIGLPAIDDGVGVLASSVCGRSVCHSNLV